jgi:hypothetical protein
MCAAHVEDGLSDKGHCKARTKESYGYQGLPKGSVRPGYLGNWGESAQVSSQVSEFGAHGLTTTPSRD